MAQKPRAREGASQGGRKPSLNRYGVGIAGIGDGRDNGRLAPHRGPPVRWDCAIPAGAIPTE